MRESGELVEWDDERGFGFIRSDTGERLFVHIKSIRRIATRPRIGDRMVYTRGSGRDGRPAATKAEIAGANPLDPRARQRGAPPRANHMGAPSVLRIAAAAALAGLAGAVVWVGRLPQWFPAFYLGMGVVSIAAYWLDKRAAEHGGWRTPERNLHAVDLLGGIAGGLVAQALLRHKTSKPAFSSVTSTIAVIHALALAALLVGVLEPG